ncbi:NAD(P)H-hydrate dehydratase [Corynebacterium aurimucosum]|uniref:bifunctional ADP-dependent NAD(P)H-hydrate dehydratase/NAD(P)H-hydrate epimerase n=1 Tax=Corynebacterium aurimucosum TaxID=169292 RepID=UPI00191E49E2|nr:bifunctional ADP-dependent NAD(P)H-hydrate dehydratase/NAD(P)H-hydrate epimerase [Corynebacterium aurimucosum]QQU96166.1 bifunctional ADP-dependent NAD(P)H-hydrate dehydratase/NAD(P)H-hydrate epimerase [Corynebacterium aurimucosum]UTA70947.1 bifunctional ADP-dependent NAD(P)H-hydrate dehydratase/NAD(P)H-hydrate epimerase [Corynebacterium aurimucosum]WJY71577.1 Bifunctional NAD(P)H-hydrate repair enzyme Nnr [Corynebacterium aurimucosum]
MRPAYTVATVRAAEKRLLGQQSHEDQLMKLAAAAVAETASVMLEARPGAVLVLAGSGGNGGDGLFAGAELASRGVTVHALVPERCHEEALAAFRSAGGAVLSADALPSGSALVIDAIAGLGSARGLSGTALSLYRHATSAGAAVLAVDMPTGVDADTGVCAADAVHADVTVTFGSPRLGHPLAPECGQVVVSDLFLPDAPSFAETLAELDEPAAFIAHEPTVPTPFAWQPGELDLPGGRASRPWPVGCTGPIVDPTPAARSDKYSGGVVALAAGSDTYPGAGILCATAAVRATPSMVRFIGDNSITSLLPELVCHPNVASSGQAQAWVVGPGRGTDAAAATELRKVLAQGLPTVIDADALTLLARNTSLRQKVTEHPMTILTPHEGEFSRLYEAAFGSAPDAATGWSRALHELAEELDSIILLKGRLTRVTAPGQPLYSFNAGHSFAATPGSGDVLSGILGAVMAQLFAESSTETAAATAAQTITEVLHAGAIHAHASAIAAETPEGFAPCSASQIAAAIPQAIARLLNAKR